LSQRFDEAYQALIDTDFPMKTLAHKISYSHVNHFITALKKKFCVTPVTGEYVPSSKRKDGITNDIVAKLPEFDILNFIH
jgi:AraC-like DNA-binding protein